MKKYTLLFIPLFTALTLIIAGCNDTTGFFYTVHNHIRTVCDADNNCGNDFYTDRGGTTYHCTSALAPCLDAVTPPVTCQPHYAYDHLVNNGQSWIVVSQQQDQNNALSPAQVTFTSTTSKTVTVTDQLHIIATLQVIAPTLIGLITANVKAEINTSVTQMVSATIGNSSAFVVPPGKTAYANYGVKVQITSGHLYDQTGCESSSGTDITYVPIASGWCVWTSDQPPCPSL